LRTLVRVASREVCYDSIELGADAPPAVGTYALIGRTADSAVLDALDALAHATPLRIGVGVLAAGLFVRVLGPAVWPVRAALDAVHACVWQRDPECERFTAAT
jgi:hypothetical protein